MGHELGVHSQHHSNLRSASKKKIRSEIMGGARDVSGDDCASPHLRRRLACSIAPAAPPPPPPPAASHPPRKPPCRRILPPAVFRGRPCRDFALLFCQTSQKCARCSTRTGSGMGAAAPHVDSTSPRLCRIPLLPALPCCCARRYDSTIGAKGGANRVWPGVMDNGVGFDCDVGGQKCDNDESYPGLWVSTACPRPLPRPDLVAGQLAPASHLPTCSPTAACPPGY